MTAPAQASATAVAGATRAITRRLTELGPLHRAPLRRRVKYKYRGGFDDAIDALIAAGRVSAQPRHGGVRYELVGQPHRRNQDRPCTRCRARKRRPTGEYCGACVSELNKTGQHP